MRELTIDECEAVAGGEWQQWSDYQDSDYPGDPGGSGGTGGTGTSGQAPYLGAPVVWTTVLDELGAFFTDMGEAVHNPGSDQNSYYNDYSGYAPLDGFFAEMFGDVLANNGMGDLHYWDYLTQDIDTEFLMTAYGPTELAAMFSGGSATMVATGQADTFQFTINGLTVYGEWHQGTATSTGPDDIVVNGGHWHFTYTGYDNSGHLLPPPPPGAPVVPGVDPATALANPEAVFETERQHLSGQLHQLLDQHGGHLNVSFNGPDGTTLTFDLADLVGIIDHYSIVTTSLTYTNTSGGAGLVHPIPGGYQTEINRAQLVGYETMAYNGLTFFILHEASHMLQMTLTYTQSQFDGWLAGGGTRATFVGTTGYNGSSALYRAESYANNIAAAVESQFLGIAPLPHPGGGYIYNGRY